MHVCICILACISVHDLKVDMTRCPTPTFTVRKILTSLLTNTVHVFTAVYMIERARHDPSLFIEAFAGKNSAYHVGCVNNGGLLQIEIRLSLPISRTYGYIYERQQVISIVIHTATEPCV